MRRRAVIAFGLVVLVAALAATVLGATERRTLAFTLSVPPQAGLIVLHPSQRACQRPISVAAGFDAVQPQLGTFRRSGPALAVTVERTSGQVLAQGRLAGGYADVARPSIPVGHVPGGGSVAVCIRNEGTRKVALYGSADAASPTSTALLDGKPTGFDAALIFRDAHPHSTLAVLPAMFDRASLFRAGWIGAWLYWTLLVVVVVGVPLLLGWALFLALRSAQSPPPSPATDMTGARSDKDRPPG
jgi:hypothetical protein